jgi:hypothetical protein
MPATTGGVCKPLGAVGVACIATVPVLQGWQWATSVLSRWDELLQY